MGVISDLHIESNSNEWQTDDLAAEIHNVF